MSTRSGFLRLTLLVSAALFALLLLLNTLQRSDQLLVPTRAADVARKEPKATPPQVQDVEEPIDEALVRQLEQELPGGGLRPVVSHRQAIGLQGERHMCPLTRIRSTCICTTFYWQDPSSTENPGNGSKVSTPTGREEDIEEPPLRFAVCVKAMDFPYEDKSWRLIEWLELMRSLGVHKVVLYDAQMHPNMTRVVRDYVKNSPGFVELRPMSLGRGEPHAPPHFHHYAMEADGFNRILNEMIPYNDCFYRNMYKYDYIGVFDIDEVIMPLGNRTTWPELIEISRAAPDYGNTTPASCKEWVSFCYRNVYYPRYPERPKVYRNLSSSFYMLQHVERVREHCNRAAATKCLHDTRFAVGLHNHFAFYHTEAASCAAKSVPIEFAQMQHYREPDTKTLLIDPIIDASIWRFQPQLQAQIEERYRRLGFLPDERQLAETLERRRLEDELILREAVGQNPE
ncbi:GL14398 [Drosophila persimilis]|uniref:Glycosyltransferase family 92 protein n=1 Tax=Drosophila persimilis TaxID=7234 RepID=B4GTQ4_DROPE|nr:GL14398 [Drosophila persimilis]